jgi:hypothetical protein
MPAVAAVEGAVVGMLPILPPEMWLAMARFFVRKRLELII